MDGRFNMEVNPILPSYYRLKFRDLILSRRRSATTQREADVLITDVYTSGRAGKGAPAVAQGIASEHKNAVADEHRTNAFIQEQDTVQQPVPKTDDWQAETSYRYVAGSAHGPPPEVRRRMENVVRKRKKANLPCPYKNRQNCCTATFIRCGDRIQFSNRESVKQQGLPHGCNYQPGLADKQILIVDEDRNILEFCKNTIEIFFGIAGGRISFANSSEHAIDVLNEFKMQGIQCGLCIADIDLPGSSGYELVNELYERNHTMEIILLSEQDLVIPMPEKYTGGIEIVPGHRYVKTVIKKPFHSAQFVEEIKAVGFKPLVEDDGYLAER
ncbi:MAG: response regulator [Chitinivibrionales bacterium]|nr:response regulator [Chitinivibrionales bacterium]